MSFELPEDLNGVFFPDLGHVILIHDEFALLTGGLPGMLKVDDLAGAVGRPVQAAHYDLDADFIKIGAYYWHGISISHGFSDGNKRTGLITAITFLNINWFDVKADESELGAIVEDWMGRGIFTLGRLDALLRERTYVLPHVQE